ncbi:MAG TPA: amidohydrolase, partial [Microbacterium sp.]|nr:amidohydrolase [Microbacterium sp.]
PLWRPADAMSGLRSLAAFRAGNLPHVHEDTVEHIIHRDALALLGLDDPRTKN